MHKGNEHIFFRMTMLHGFYLFTYYLSTFFFLPLETEHQYISVTGQNTAA